MLSTTEFVPMCVRLRASVSFANKTQKFGPLCFKQTSNISFHITTAPLVSLETVFSLVDKAL
jgi:hypothetical protein